MSNPGDWLYDTSANKFNNTYFRDYYGVNNGIAVDISGDLVVREGASIGAAKQWVGSCLELRKPSGTAINLVYLGGGNGDKSWNIQQTSAGDTLSFGYTSGFNVHPYSNILNIDGTGTGKVGIKTSPYGNWDLHIYNASSQTNLAIQTGAYGWVLHHQDSSNPGPNLYFLYSGNSFASWSTKAYVSLNGSGGQMNFTGQHRTFVENVLHTDASNNQGLIVCANKNTYVGMNEQIKKGNNAITQNESLPLVSLCTKSKDKSCFGVISESEDPNERSDRCGNFVTPYEKEEGDTRIYINSLGEGAIWVSNKNGPLESGDYITTSDIPGYGEKQDSEFLANYTVAKITMDCDFNPQLQPKEIILKEAVVDDSGNTVYKNVLDANGEIQWTPELDSDGNVVQEYPYNLRYLDLQGARLTKAEYDTKLANGEQVHIAAYVGCTYHCG